MRHVVRTIKTHVMIWLRRYLPSEALGFVCAFCCAALAMSLTHHPALTATAAAWGEALGYYGLMFGREASIRHRHLEQVTVTALALLAVVIVRDLFLEFGISEVLDSLLIRPLAMYTSLQWISNLALALVIGKLIADIFFYVPTVLVFEVRERKAARRRTEA